GPVWDSLRPLLDDVSIETWTDVVHPFVEETLGAHHLPMPPAGSPLMSQLLEAFRVKLLLLSDWAYSQTHSNGRYVAPPPVEPRAPLSVEAARQAEQDAVSQLPISKVLEAWAEAKRLD